MIFIIAACIVSSLLMNAASNSKEELSTKYYIIFAVSILLFFATFRDITVGTDVATYQKRLFDIADDSLNIISYSEKSSLINTDYGYDILVYFIARICPDIHMLFLIEELLVLIPVYYVIWNYRERLDVGITSLAYNLLYYAETFNIIRQNIAIAWSFLAFFFLEKNKKGAVVLSVITAFLFHSSALVFLIVPILYKYFNAKNRKKFYLSAGLYFLLVSCVSIYYKQIIKFSGKIFPFLPRRYFNEKYLVRDKINIQAFNLIIAIMAAFLVVQAYKRIKNVNWINFVFINILTSIATTYFTASTAWAFRIIWYFSIYQIIGFGVGTYALKKSVGNYCFYYFLVCILLTGNWIYFYAICGSSGVVPYKLMF